MSIQLEHGVRETDSLQPWYHLGTIKFRKPFHKPQTPHIIRQLIKEGLDWEWTESFSADLSESGGMKGLQDWVKWFCLLSPV